MKNQEDVSVNFCKRLTHSSTFVPIRKRESIIRDNLGFTLIELIMVSAILTILATFAIPIYTRFLDSTKASRSMADIRTLEKDITAYMADKGVYPDNLNQINRADLLDPWGNPYVYTNLTIVGSVHYKDIYDQDMNDDFDLYSKGKNGNTTGDLDDTISLDDIVRSGDGGNVGLGSLY
jgi:general secretion pathway protein G